MSISTKDGLWDRNFQSFEQNELDKDIKLEDEIKITWAHISCLKRQTASHLIIGNGKSCYVFDALLKDKFYKIATIKYVKHKSDAINSQRGPSKNVVIYSTKNPLAPDPAQQFGNLSGTASILMAQSGQLNIKKKPPIIFVYAPNVPSNYYYAISQFITMHFRPQNVICLDILARGLYVQNYDELQMPQLRKIYSTTSYRNDIDDDDKKQNIDSCLAMKNVPFLETGNLISSFSGSVLQECEYNGIDGYLFVSISDLDYLTETLISFGNVLMNSCPQLRKLLAINKNVKSVVTKKCAKYANKNGYLLTGRNMFC